MGYKLFLLKTVRESDRMTKESVELFDLYKYQNLTGLGVLLAKSDDYTSEEMEALLTHRNKKWIREMPDMMKSGTVFFAVGAEHLVGDDGLISLLKSLGYTLKPLALN